MKKNILTIVIMASTVTNLVLHRSCHEQDQ